MCGGEGDVVRVTLLDGTTITIPLSHSMTIRDIKRHLMGMYSKYEGCRLLNNGCLLRNGQVVGDLQQGAECVEMTAIPCSRKSGKKYECKGGNSRKDANVRTDKACVGKDTLLPGYNLRPNPSPVKSKRGAATPSQAMNVQEKDDVQRDDAIIENEEGVFVSNADMMNRFPQLPDALARLEHTYDVIWNIHAFFTGKVRSRCTLKSTREMLTDQENSLKDIDALVTLCPCMVVLGHSESCCNVKRFSSCLECSDECYYEILYPWKSRGDQIPDAFRRLRKNMESGHIGQDSTENPSKRKRKRTEFGQKRMRQCWILRKCLLNWLLSEYHPRYDSLGLWLVGISDEQVNQHILEARGDFKPCDFIAWCEMYTCDTVRYMKSHEMGKRGQKEEGNAPPVMLKKAPPCTDTCPLTPESLLNHIKGLEYYSNQIVYEKYIPPREAKLVSVKRVGLSEDMEQYLKQDLGITELYSHQAEAVDCVIKRGKSCIVSTSTASGKSFCYLIPIFESILRDQNSCALLIFPTKALSQDQLRNIRGMSKCILGAAFEENVHIYDGDTPYEDRNEIVLRSRILLTNPDMLHCSILPFHRKFRGFLENLHIVWIDEAHMYCGVFGAHVALVLRRLKRLCRLYGSKPTVVLTTATVSNPKQHASSLLGVDDIELVSIDGSPQQAKTFALWNPPVLRNYSNKQVLKADQEERWRNHVRHARQERNFPSLLGASEDQNRLWKKSVADGHVHFINKSSVFNAMGNELPPSMHQNASHEGVEARMPSRKYWRERVIHLESKSTSARRSSPMVEVAFLLSECVKHGLRTIAFCKTRKLAELVGAYTREIVAATSPGLVNSISTYRAGYNALERREIERKMFSGELLGTCATNALELGVDIGGLDVTLHLGYQGTVASLWQQAGRAGRRDRQSLSMYVAFDGPLDQYFMSNPNKLFDKAVEAAYIDISNGQILEAHCRCAAYEMNLDYSEDRELFGSDHFTAVVRGLIEKNELSLHPDCPGSLRYSGKHSLPARSIALRDIDQDKYTIVDDMGRVLEEIESRKINFVCYDGAIYMSQGQTYIVKSVDYSSRVAHVCPTDVKYYTTTIDYTDVHLTGEKKMCGNAGKTFVGYATITTRWMGYARVRRGSGKVFDTVDLFVPDAVYETVAISQRLPKMCRHHVDESGNEFRDSLHAAAHAVMNVLPLYVMCNAEDIGTECDNQYDTRYKPERLLIFEKYPGGIGLCEKLEPIFQELIQAAMTLVQSCPCTSEDGCPMCVQSTVCSEYNNVLSKSGAQIILQNMLQDG